ncbi:MAG: 4Fe-4S dicluster domain-containing protein [Thermoclostridium sp.]|nr:4Fe-4S dicluster domain-containing protein [Thermoclostridium sp.]
MTKYFHSVTLDEDKCRGCTNCIKHCPTEAIRVRNGKAIIIRERCIDCGECIKVCPYHAKKAVTDPFSVIQEYRYKVAIPAPSLYGQFSRDYSRDRILQGLIKLGFDWVLEVSQAAEIVSDATRILLETGGLKKPVISSACPAVVRLVQVRFPNLIPNLLKIESPMELAARIAKDTVCKEKGIPVEQIGVFFISPCAAKVTSVKAPYEKKESSVNGVLAMKDIHIPLLDKMGKIPEDIESDLVCSGFDGVGWARSGGESYALRNEQYLAVHGIHQVIKILEEIVEDRLEGVEFVECLSCTEGCLGGPLTVVNPFVARTNLKWQIKKAKQQDFSGVNSSRDYEDLLWTEDVEYKPILKLDDDMVKAMKKMQKMQEINEGLPGLDCGACGAPSCQALSEDIVRGLACETDCIFKLREKVSSLSKQMKALEQHAKENP